MKRNWSLVGILTVIILLLTFLFGPNVIDRFKKVKIVYRVDESQIILPEGLVTAIRNQGIMPGKELPNSIYNITLRNESPKVCIKPIFNIKTDGQIYEFKITDTNEDKQKLYNNLTIEEENVSFSLDRLGPRSFIVCNLWINGRLDIEPITVSADNEFILQRASGESELSRSIWSDILFFTAIIVAILLTLSGVGLSFFLRKASLLKMRPIKLEKLFNGEHNSVFTPESANFAGWFDTPNIRYSEEIEEVSFLVRTHGHNIISLSPKTETVLKEISIGLKIQAIHLLYAYKPNVDDGSIKMEILYEDGAREINRLYLQDYLARLGDVVRVFELQDSSKKGAINYEKVNIRNKNKKTDKVSISNSAVGSQLAIIAVTAQRK